MTHEPSEAENIERTLLNRIIAAVIVAVVVGLGGYAWNEMRVDIRDAREESREKDADLVSLVNEVKNTINSQQVQIEKIRGDRFTHDDGRMLQSQVSGIARSVAVLEESQRRTTEDVRRLANAIERYLEQQQK